ncbi:hypothetical protein ASE99_01505 [Serratia sp. Leaf51]|nr:hypothetical protein ASE99_01505 [Serratia sp. Leaf51]
MGKVTFVVEFEDGKEPALSASTSLLGGKLVAFAWRDLIHDQVVSVDAELPSANDEVLLFDANGEGWVIGWCSMWMAMGQKETGEWEWSFQLEGLCHEDVRITHWASIPDEPAPAGEQS